MSGFLLRFKLTNLKRRGLVISLIATEIIGIIALLWYLRTPLTEKFLFSPPKAYSLVTMDPKKRYLVSQGDYLQGNGIPNSQIRALFTPGNLKKTASVDPQGNFTLQVPGDTELRTYRLTIANLDKNNDLAYAKGYKVRIQTNNLFLRNPLIGKIISFFQPKKASALDGTPGTDYDWERVVGPEWKEWINLWHQAGICPAIDDSGEIVTYMNKEVYDEIYGPLYTCPAIESLKGWLDEIAYDKGFFVDLYLELALRGYPEESFIDFFPDWKEFLAENRTVRIDSVPKPAYKHYGEKIDETTLVEIMYDVAVRKNYREKSSLLKFFLNSTDPILGLRGPYNILSGYKFTNGWDYVDGLLAILSFVPGKAQAQAGIKTATNVTEKNIASMTLKREAIVKNGAVFTQSQLADAYAAPARIIRRGAGDPTGALSSIENLINRRAYTDVARLYSGSSSNQIQILLHFVDIGEAAAMKKEIAQAYVDNFLSSVKNYFSANGRTIELWEKDYQGLVDDNRIIFFTPDAYEKLGNRYALATANEAYITIKTGSDVDLVMNHELAHSNAWYSLIRRKWYNADTFEFKGKDSGIYGAVMSEWIELGADLVNTRIFGAQEAPYFTHFPKRYQAIEELIRVLRDRGANLSELDFIEFGLTRDDRVLMAKITPYVSADEFLRIVGETWSQEGIESLNKGARTALDKLKVPVINPDGKITYTSFSAAGFVPMTLSDYYAKSAIGETIPENVIIIDPLEDDAEDVDLLSGATASSNPPLLDIQITTVEGNNGVLTVTQPASFDSVLSKNGYSEDPNNYAFNWVAEGEGSANKTDVSELTNILCQTNGSTSCFSTLPDIEPGQYIIKLYITKSGSNSIIGTGTYSIPVTVQAITPQTIGPGDDSTPVISNNCSPSNWKDETPYSCQDGWACYYRWKIAGGSSCDPERDYGEDGQPYICLEDSNCRTVEQGGDS